jgi:hypothetical protein
MPERVSTSEAAPDEVSALLSAWTDGDQQALARLTPIVYDELRRLLQQAFTVQRRNRPDHEPDSQLEREQRRHPLCLGDLRVGRAGGSDNRQSVNFPPSNASYRHRYGVHDQGHRFIVVAVDPAAAATPARLIVNWPQLFTAR